MLALADPAETDKRRRVALAAAQTAPDGLDTGIRIGQKQLPGARQQHGFTGFLLLADRAAGKLVPISLWESRDDLRADCGPSRFAARQRENRRLLRRK
jgi:hypothetical protein